VETFDDSYHGQATALGSEDVASCSDCHGTHGVFGEDDPRSMIHQANLVESCGTCHEESRAAFVQYQPHADHNDRENYPAVYWSYRAMTALLLGVFSVFGIHSALWVMRLALDARRQPVGGDG
ncbi:MAG: cytochrome C, partial [Gemmatimonadetes bacterium]|nr:cytochrome C [Gemmatimonadota bacterium]